MIKFNMFSCNGRGNEGKNARALRDREREYATRIPQKTKNTRRKNSII